MIEDELAGLRAIASRHLEVDLYIFGSAVHGHKPPLDLDVLAVYGTLESFDVFRADLDRQAFAPLIDLIAMTLDELLGAGFLGRSRAIPLGDLA